MKLYIKQIVTYTHEIELAKPIQSDLDLDSVLDEIENMTNSGMIYGNINEVSEVLESKGFIIAGECEDGSPNTLLEIGMD